MPDLDQIKQGEQMTTSALEGPAWRFAGIPSVGITDPFRPVPTGLPVRTLRSRCVMNFRRQGCGGRSGLTDFNP
jgi:hypothetical protein